MTNAMIILMESVRLMEAGVIGSTGRSFTVTDRDGNEKTLMEPEPIHTFAAWKALGYSVKKGEHAVARFPIWKGAEKAVKDDDGNETGEKAVKMFMKSACFFSPAQVEKTKDRPERNRSGRKGGSRALVAPVAASGYGNWLADA